MQPKLFLVHGLFFRGSWLGYMRHRLASLGYGVHCISYPSTGSDTHANAMRLIRCAEQHSTPAETRHFVGHSLGGLVIRCACTLRPNLFTGRVVTLGTPHTGSSTAVTIRHRLHPAILGKSYASGLDGNLPPLPEGIELGSLAGSRGIGVNNLLHTLPAPNDGTVAVAETVLHGATDHIVLPVTHTEMVYSRAVREQIDCFLQNGHFRHSTHAATPMSP